MHFGVLQSDKRPCSLSAKRLMTCLRPKSYLSTHFCPPYDKSMTCYRRCVICKLKMADLLLIMQNRRTLRASRFVAQLRLHL